ncbi:MAG: hypothetical protein ACI8W0_001791 [Flavobacterium sp.]|jgi:hypothetical protein
MCYLLRRFESDTFIEINRQQAYEFQPKPLANIKTE